jgi:hypothetical protein
MKFLAAKLTLGSMLALAGFSAAWDGSSDQGGDPYGPAEPTYRIKVWGEYEEDFQEANLVCIEHVREQLDPLLHQRAQRTTPIADVRRVLQACYGVGVVETLTAPGYVWFWTGERWVMFCLAVSSFEIDFGARGEVYVEVEEGLLMH